MSGDEGQKPSPPAVSVPVEVEQRLEPITRILPLEKQVELRQLITSIQFQGPLPPPSMLAEYGQVIPNGADRLMTLLEKQTDHRIDMESRMVKGRISTTRVGQIIAACLSVFFGVVALILGLHGHEVLAGSLGVTTIIGLATVFVLGKEPGKREPGDGPDKQKSQAKRKR